MSPTKIIRCVVACMGCDGPAFFPCKVRVTEEGYQNGCHYDLAEGAALDAGYDEGCVTFDENDGPGWLFVQFDWALAITCDA